MKIDNYEEAMALSRMWHAGYNAGLLAAATEIRRRRVDPGVERDLAALANIVEAMRRECP